MTTAAAAQLSVAVSRQWKIRAAETFCWAVWATLLLMNVWILLNYTWNIPMSEDWNLVPSFAGMEKHFGAWLWEQNNEHRVPLPKLILLAILKLTGGSFKAGMLANIAFLAAISAAMMLSVRSGRGGHSRFADAFFPVIFLNVGHWENIFWAWEFTFVLSVVLGLVPLVVLAARRPLNFGRALWIGGALACAPLCGATGLLFVPVLVMWAAYAGLTLLRTVISKRTAWTLLGSAVVAASICGLYFVGYTRPEWTGPPPTLSQAFLASLQFMALAFGPVARSAWALSIPLTLIIIGMAGLCFTLALRHTDRDERLRRLGLCAFFVTALLYAAAIGHGRARVISGVYFTFPLRYCLLAVPLLCVAYVAIDQFGPAHLRRLAPSGMCALVCALLPLNTAQGCVWAKYFQPSYKGVSEDISNGLSSEQIAIRHNKFLVHWKTQSEAAELVRMAMHAKIPPFSLMKAESDPHPPNRYEPRANQLFKMHEIRCRVSGATKVVLVWGVDGWKWLPQPWLPDETFFYDDQMHTRMEQDGNLFRTKVWIPEGERLDYGLQIVGRGEDSEWHPTWQPGAESVPLPNQNEVIDLPVQISIDVDGIPIVRPNGTPLTYQVRYHAPGASEVRFHWGINGWYSLGPELKPPGTEIINSLMTIRMVRQGDTFVASVPVPTGATIDYGFTTLKHAGVFDLLEPIWDGSPKFHAVVTEPSTVTVNGSAPHVLDWIRSIPSLRSWEICVATFSAIWAGLFAASSWANTHKTCLPTAAAPFSSAR
jgi:hypothetical protein